MGGLKRRNWSKQEDEDLIEVMRELEGNMEKITWNFIAERLQQKNAHYNKNGKQCRERWVNQLSPNLKRSEEWSKEQNDILFSAHSKIGNRWSEIVEKLPGRTGNCLKNHFYSTLRRGMKKINNFICNIKRKTVLVKTIKQQVLNKIVTLCDDKLDNKFHFTEQAKSLASSIKECLVDLSLNYSDDDTENIEYKNKIYEMICEFTRNCRKRKSKKNQSYASEVESKISEKQSYHENEQSNEQIHEEIRAEKAPLCVELERSQVNVKKVQVQILQNYSSTIDDKATPIMFMSKEEKNLELYESYGSSKLLNSNLLKSKNSVNSLFGPGANIEASLDWFKRSENYGDIKVCGFINSVPQVGKSTGSFSLFGENENKRGEFNFATFDVEGFRPDFQNIFRIKQSNFPQNLKSQELEKSFSFSQISENGLKLQPNPELLKSSQINFNCFPFPSNWLYDKNLKHTRYEDKQEIGKELNGETSKQLNQV